MSKAHNDTGNDMRGSSILGGIGGLVGASLVSRLLAGSGSGVVSNLAGTVLNSVLGGGKGGGQGGGMGGSGRGQGRGMGGGSGRGQGGQGASQDGSLGDAVASIIQNLRKEGLVSSSRPGQGGQGQGKGRGAAQNRPQANTNAEQQASATQVIESNAIASQTATATTAATSLSEEDFQAIEVMACYITSFSAGRVRLRHQGLIMEEIQEPIKKRLYAAGITEAVFNAQAGSVLLTYDANTMSKEAFLVACLPLARYINDCEQILANR